MRRSVSLAVLGLAAATALSACGSDSSGGSKSDSGASGGSSQSSADTGSGGTPNGKGASIGIILPDRQSSNRWISSDPQALAARCKAVNLKCDIQNANGDAAQFVSIGQNMMNKGAKLLILVAIDPASAKKVEDQAKAKNIVTIDYDRLVTGGSSALYVSFDNTKVGEVQGESLVKCPEVADSKSVKYVQLNGAPTDNNATLFRNGYQSVLSKQSGWTKVADQSIPDWSNQQAGITFSTMLQKTPDLGAVMVANDGMAGPVVGALKKQGRAGKVAVSGQDATVEGLQRIMSGTQCFTIYKPSKQEANPAVDAAAQLVTGQVPKTTQVTVDPKTKRKVPSILATPIAITKDNVAQPINDGYTPKATTCKGSYASLCSKAGVK